MEITTAAFGVPICAPAAHLSYTPHRVGAVAPGNQGVQGISVSRGRSPLGVKADMTDGTAQGPAARGRPV